MNKFFKNALVVAVSFTGVAAFAQTEDDVTLNVNLANTYSIVVSQPVVDIPMNTPAHFQSGSTSGVQADHITISATGEYEVTVQTSAEFFSGPDADISTATVQVVPTLGSYTGPGTAPTVDRTYATPQLSQTENSFILGDAGEISRSFNVEYKILQDDASAFLNHTAGTYTTTVTYTIAAP